MTGRRHRPVAASPGRVVDIAADIRSGARTPADAVQACLDRIAEVDAQVEAWVSVDSAGALALAAEMGREAGAGRFRGPLHGVPVGIKDICDVAGWPTRCNSRTRAAAPPASADAEIVTALRTAGAIMLGKTQTTEFAFYDPSPTRNPHDLSRTPGGSSSGSGAAVAAGMVPAAVGTQTVASVNRPAAYCGVAAFKPSTRSMSTHGIAPLAPAFDTPGVYGWSVADACRLYEAIRPAHARADGFADEDIRAVVIDDPFLSEADDEIMAARDRVVGHLRDAGCALEEIASPVSLEELNELQGHMTMYELARVHADLLEFPEDQVGPALRQAVIEGGGISDEVCQAERRRIDAMRSAFFDTVRPADLALWPATPKTAPKGLEWTGDRRYIAPWTALGGPIVSLPAGVGEGGLPIGMLLAGAPGCDRYVARVAPRLADAVPRDG